MAKQDSRVGGGSAPSMADAPASTPVTNTPASGEQTSPATQPSGNAQGGESNPAKSEEKPAVVHEAPAPVLAPAVNEERLSKLESRLDRVLGLAEQQQDELSQLRQENDRLRAMGAPAVQTLKMVDPMKTKLEELAIESKRREEEHNAVDAELLAGPRKYACSMTKQARSERIVGASSEIEAEIKYKKYMGINGVLDPQIKFEWHEVSVPAEG